MHPAETKKHYAKQHYLLNRCFSGLVPCIWKLGVTLFFEGDVLVDLLRSDQHQLAAHFCFWLCSIATLMVGFFSYFVLRFDWTAGFVPAREATSDRLAHRILREKNACLQVEDWLDITNNAARALDERGKERVMQVGVGIAF